MKLFAPLLLVSICSTLALAQDDPCWMPDFYHSEVTNKCYHYSNEFLNFEQNVEYCRGLTDGASLVEIKTEAETYAITDVFPSQDEQAYIGLR